jgi:hypothetical protein
MLLFVYEKKDLAQKVSLFTVIDRSRAAARTNMSKHLNVFLNHACLVKRYDDALCSLFADESTGFTPPYYYDLYGPSVGNHIDL